MVDFRASVPQYRGPNQVSRSLSYLFIRPHPPHHVPVTRLLNGKQIHKLGQSGLRCWGTWGDKLLHVYEKRKYRRSWGMKDKNLMSAVVFLLQDSVAIMNIRP